jgi:DNA-binding MarR family transcriptional regulator
MDADDFRANLSWALYEAAMTARRMSTERLAALDIDGRQFGLLTLLALGGTWSQQALGEALHIDRTTMVGLIDHLEAQHFVARQRNPSDRRLYALALTERGRQLQQQARDVLAACEQRFLAPLSAAEQAELRRLVGLLTAPAASDERPR